MRPTDQVQQSPEQVVLSPEEYAANIASAYTKAIALTETNNSVILPGPMNNRTNAEAPATPRIWKSVSDEKGATALVRLFGVMDTSATPGLENWLLEKIAILPEELKSLASARARAIKDYLVQTGKVEAERITCTESVQSSNAKGSCMYLRLQ
jgi:hypothetical protein